MLHKGSAFRFAYSPGNKELFNHDKNNNNLCINKIIKTMRILPFVSPVCVTFPALIFFTHSTTPDERHTGTYIYIRFYSTQFYTASNNKVPNSYK